MKKRMLLLLFPLLISCGGNNSSQEIISSTYKATNEELAQHEELPFIHDNKMILPDIGGSREVPDPFVYRFNGKYYLYATTGGKKIKGYVSEDMYNWEPVDNGINPYGYVYDYSFDGGSAPSAQTPYAPEVIYYNGLFYMVTSPDGRGHYILTSETPDGPFTNATENLGRSIDGSFFINSDESVYMYGASSGPIINYAMENDLLTFLSDDNDKFIEIPLQNCRVGNWNEGPYMLQRNGEYYLTYCGTHYLSPSYRIDYAYAKEGADLLKSSSYVRKDTIAVATDDEFRGLGHSSTVLGPDMDSYMLVYHNLEQNNVRYLNYARLSFNGSKMVANDVKKDAIVGIDLPPFYTYGRENYHQSGNFLLSDSSSEKNFTVEFNVIGNGKMIFSFIDENNYSYIEYLNNGISIHTITNGNDKEIHRINLINEYDTSVNHTFRLQHRDGLMNVYFDTMEKAFNVEAEFKGGKIGYLADNKFSDIGYSAFSNVARGSSDNKHYNQEMTLANAYDEKLSYLTSTSGLKKVGKGKYLEENSYNLSLESEGDRATYRIYKDQSAEYLLNLRLNSLSQNIKFGLQIDGGEIKEYNLTLNAAQVEKGDVLINIDTLNLAKGQHNISIYNLGQNIEFSEIHLPLKADGENIEYIFDESFVKESMITRNVRNIDTNGIALENDPLGAVITREKYFNKEVKSTIFIEDIDPSGYVGIGTNISDYSKNYSGDGDGGENDKSYRGYRFYLDSTSVYFDYVDFNFTRNLKTKSFDFIPGEEYLFAIKQNNNTYECYINDELIFNITSNLGNLQGQAASLGSRAYGYIKNLSVN